MNSHIAIVIEPNPALVSHCSQPPTRNAVRRTFSEQQQAARAPKPYSSYRACYQYQCSDRDALAPHCRMPLCLGFWAKPDLHPMGNETSKAATHRLHRAHSQQHTITLLGSARRGHNIHPLNDRKEQATTFPLPRDAHGTDKAGVQCGHECINSGDMRHKLVRSPTSGPPPNQTARDWTHVPWYLATTADTATHHKWLVMYV